jgi:hypothetical protein
MPPLRVEFSFGAGSNPGILETLCSTRSRVSGGPFLVSHRFTILWLWIINRWSVFPSYISVGFIRSGKGCTETKSGELFGPLGRKNLCKVMPPLRVEFSVGAGSNPGMNESGRKKAEDETAWLGRDGSVENVYGLDGLHYSRKGGEEGRSARISE